MNMNVDTIIQGGAVGIAVLMIIYCLIRDRMWNKTMNNHLQHFTDAINNNSKVIGGNSEVIKNCKKTLVRMDYRLDK